MLARVEYARTLPLTKDEFADSLHKGLGRAALHLREHGSTGIEGPLLDACLNSRVYDPQCEGTRGEWLYHLLGFARMRELARPEILRALHKPRTDETDFWTVCQLLALAAQYCHAGDGEMRRAIYEVFDRQEYQEGYVGGHQIICLDGMDGLLHVVRVLGARLLRDPGYFVDEHLLSAANEALDEEVVHSTLAGHAKSDKDVLAFVDGVEATRKRWDSNSSLPRKSLNDVLTAVEEAKDRCIWLMRWGRHASREELTAILDRILSENRPAQLARYLRVFSNCEMPRVSPGILKLAESADERVRWAATRALANLESDDVREAAIGLLKMNPPRTNGMRMLVKNYRDGDHVLLESSLPTGGDADTTHEVVLDITALSGEIKKVELAPCLLWAYEHSPCSECRYSTIGHMVELNVAPPLVLSECLFDCFDDTRALARSVLGLTDVDDFTCSK